MVFQWSCCFLALMSVEQWWPRITFCLELTVPIRPGPPVRRPCGPLRTDASSLPLVIACDCHSACFAPRSRLRPSLGLGPTGFDTPNCLASRYGDEVDRRIIATFSSESFACGLVSPRHGDFVPSRFMPAQDPVASRLGTKHMPSASSRSKIDSRQY